ncbi:preprotein translocase subunit SecA [Acinetobacter sp. MD2]|uniref:preprotein translocase subunit SecA n=1 Tax=Acinetobacter sp. MD2 TaxID=2600066 RepID=UPI002D1EE15C|nr:preprotein translocase subunit SecA [Acinetobacter sp. MD2]MEB3768054.1 preprotein translocase subunit SecA [Acinetobacter sp. MD2]
MSRNAEKRANKFNQVHHNSLRWKLYLLYDILMMILIVVNLFCLGANALLMSNFATWLTEHLHIVTLLEFYKQHLHPWVNKTEGWFISFLIAELLIRWAIAIIQRHHQRWFFFPFVHWYEILAIIPMLRFLRLFRAGIIAYRLHEIGYQVIPDAWQKRGYFYYQVLMEELSDRVVITVIDGIRHELNTSSSHKKIIHDLVDHHRDAFAKALAELLQENLATALQQQQQYLVQHVGRVVQQAVTDTPEIHQLLRPFPIVGSHIENQLKNIGKRLGENISQGLLEPFTTENSGQPNVIYQQIALKLSQVDIAQPSLESFIESTVYESLESIRKQVKVKQWQQILAKSREDKR